MADAGAGAVTQHCGDLQADRDIGAMWEKKFCVLAAKRHGKSFTAHQIGRTNSAVAFCFDQGWNPYTLPDITIWSSPGDHHEIKHKNPTNHGYYGLEDYRLRALKCFADETQQAVQYTIHDWEKAGGRHVTVNREEDWVTANINDLWEATLNGTAYSAFGNSYVAGQTRHVKIWYWPTRLWQPLNCIWKAAE